MKHVRLGWAIAILLAVTTTCVSTAFGAPVILNEYNAVDGGADKWLDEDGLTGSTKSDTYFDRIKGNGGDWFELVVVGDGTAGSVVDMRGWEIDINKGVDNKGHLKLSNNAYWSNVQAGTILTFSETENADGEPVGQPADTSTEIHKVNKFDTEGWAWTNIYADDATYIDTADGNHDPGYPISDEDSQFVIYQSDGATVVFGPAGEDVSPSGGVGTREVMKLEADPSPSITEFSGDYTDGTSSSFGSPNPWTDNSVPFVQDFGAFIVPEPATIALLLSGAISLALYWRRMRKA